MGEAFAFWVHLLAAVLWIGPQVFMFVAAVPALRRVEDPRQRSRALDTLTTRFALLSGGALLVLVISGVGNIFEREDELGFNVFDYDHRYAWILTVKVALVGAAVALTALHTLVLGLPMLRLARRAAEDPAAAERYQRMRRYSVLTSVLNLLAGLAILYLGVLLQNAEFSHRLV